MVLALVGTVTGVGTKKNLALTGVVTTLPRAATTLAPVTVAATDPAAPSSGSSAIVSPATGSSAVVGPSTGSSASVATPVAPGPANGSSAHVNPASTVGPTITATRAVTTPPAATTSKPPPTTPNTASVNLCGAPANPYGYNFCQRGGLITSPAADTCSYFNCIANFPNGKGYMEQCKDGTYSMSGGIQGACSHHGGEMQPVSAGP